MEMLAGCYSSRVDDQLLLSPICNHGMVIEEITRAHELTSQLQVLLLPLLPAGSWSELFRDHIREMIKCYNSVLSRLQADGSCRPLDVPDHLNDQRGAGYFCTSDEKRKRLEAIDWPNDHKRRRRKEKSCSIVTSVPYEDGHQWRKYGQKLINGAKHPRNYFRCTYSKDEGCQAKKTVQQDDSNADPPKYHVVYTMPHTCNYWKMVKADDLPSLTATTTTEPPSKDNVYGWSSQVLHYFSPPSAAATPNRSQSTVNGSLSVGNQEPMPSQVTASQLPRTSDMLSFPISTWESSVELDAYLKTMMYSSNKHACN